MSGRIITASRMNYFPDMTPEWAHQQAVDPPGEHQSASPSRFGMCDREKP
jgi:hypothetical protein